MVKEERSDTERIGGDCVSCQDAKEDTDKSVGEMGFVSTEVSEPLRVQHMCDKKCNDQCFRFIILQPQ